MSFVKDVVPWGRLGWSCSEGDGGSSGLTAACVTASSCLPSARSSSVKCSRRGTSSGAAATAARRLRMRGDSSDMGSAEKAARGSRSPGAVKIDRRGERIAPAASSRLPPVRGIPRCPAAYPRGGAARQDEQDRGAEQQGNEAERLGHLEDDHDGRWRSPRLAGYGRSWSAPWSVRRRGRRPTRRRLPPSSPPSRRSLRADGPPRRCGAGRAGGRVVDEGGARRQRRYQWRTAPMPTSPEASS